MASPDFDEFYDSFLGDSLDSMKDGPNPSALQRLTGDEKQKAEDLLLQRLSLNDSRTALGLGELRSVKGATRLRSLLQQCTLSESDSGCGADFMVQAAVALWKIEGFTNAPDCLIGILQTDVHEYHRMKAAIASREVHTDAIIAALFTALNDSESLVRYHAANSLLELRGISTKSIDPKRPSVALMSDDLAKRELAIDSLKKLFQAGNTRR